MRFFEPCSTIHAWQAWLLALATVFITSCSSVVSDEVLVYFYCCIDDHLYSQYSYQIGMIAMQMRIAYMGLVYRKVSDLFDSKKIILE